MNIFGGFFQYFSYFCSKHRLWVQLEPPPLGGSNEYPQPMFWSKNKKKRYITPAYPSFTVLKWGLRGYTLHGHVFLMLEIDSYWEKHLLEESK